MATNDARNSLKPVRQRNYLARDFDSFRAVLLDYAAKYYPDRIKDFSESSLGGLFLDMAATVGDNLSFYLDHLYGELNSDTVVETRNKERIIRQAGIPIAGASAAVVYQDFYVEVPVLQDGSLRPDPDLIPTIKSQTTLRSNSGIDFTLMEDVEFWTVDSDGVIRVASDVEVTNGRRVSGSVVSKVLRKRGLCSSGTQTSETFTIGDFSAFRRIQLAQSNVTQIISVTDGLGNDYYEVENLTHDVVYKNVANNTGDVSVKDNLKVVPAPYRFVSETSLSTRKTTLIFGGGTADDLEDDIIPDPSEFSIPMPFSQTFSSTPVNPHRLLQTTTLGVAAANTTLTVTYRYGGGKNRNAPPTPAAKPNPVAFATQALSPFSHNNFPRPKPTAPPTSPPPAP
jgi:hypothetical protein